ncbi:MAG: C39 family peptidase, partial [Anaerolineales bacterium]|nr:C39 family peptidase [Anaerolineales bacterium]
ILFILVGTLLAWVGWFILVSGLDWAQALGVSYSEPTVLSGFVFTPTQTPLQPIPYTPTDTTTPTWTPSPTPSPTPTNTLTPTPSATPTPSLTPSPTLTPTPLMEARIKGIQGRWPAYSLDCETRSAVDWAAYFGVQINEIEFFNKLPVSDDPNRGFVGNVHEPWGQTPPNSYGVHAAPVAKVLRSYGLSALARDQMTFDELRTEISAQRPVVVWVVGRVGEGTPIPYTSSAGRNTTVARFEHTVIVIGYTQQEVTVLDGNWIYPRQIQDFMNSWGVLGNMAVVWSGDAGQ